MKLYQYEVEEVFADVFRIADTPAMNSFLIRGSERGMLIDTGCGAGNIRAVAEKLCPEGFVTVNTHAHSDHTAADYQFDEVYVPEKEIAGVRRLFTDEREKNMHFKMMAAYKVSWFDPSFRTAFENARDSFRIIPVREGDRFDLGNTVIEAIEVPGHTAGGMAYLDTRARRLYNGDIILRHASILHEGGTDIATLIRGLEKLWTHHDRFDLTIAAHGHRHGFEPLEKEKIRSLIRCASEACVERSVPRTEYDGEGFEYSLADDDISIAFRPDQL